MSGINTLPNGDASPPTRNQMMGPGDFLHPPPKYIAGRLLEVKNAERGGGNVSQRGGVGPSLTDTPDTTAPNSPRIRPRGDSASSTPRIRPTTLDIPGLTRSKVSPDGRIASRDIGSKLIIVMVGLPARGKSYITKKMARYLNWLQHDTRIFNVGERRRVAANTPGLSSSFESLPPPAQEIDTHLNVPPIVTEDTSTDADHESSEQDDSMNTQPMDQSADFFDPKNTKASRIREQLAMSTLDELLDYVLVQGGSVGILDATNSTLERRKAIMMRVRERAGPHLGVLFLESLCVDKNLLESNMRLKLSGPDYKDQDPVKALADFRRRVAIYEENYVPLGQFEERNNMQYVQASLLVDRVA
ncbi:MAG: hypothetical protein M1816_001290 [Peltula sp. TS41687]|nr:MAG: hypothetical protein M1816_001290 [Peltula sp. TS41687]